MQHTNTIKNINYYKWNIVVTKQGRDILFERFLEFFSKQKRLRT